MRKLASVQKIEEVQGIPNADRVCRYRVLGWWVVDQVDKYSVGDTVIYCEPDSVIPPDLQRDLFYSDKPEEEIPKLQGFVLKTKKICKVYSQGILIPIELVDGYPLMIGDDVSEILGIVKYEPIVPATLAGNAKGVFPSFITKTDEARIQSIADQYEHYHNNVFCVTEKLEGASQTIYIKGGNFGVCSRNLELKEDANNAYWQVAKKFNIEDRLKSEGLDNIVFQGELIGPGVQGNIYKLKELEFYVFNVFLIDKGEYLPYNSMKTVCETIGLKCVPRIYQEFKLPSNIDELLELAEGKSSLAPVEREGLVFRTDDRSISFKVISNKYLSKKE